MSKTFKFHITIMDAHVNNDMHILRFDDEEEDEEHCGFSTLDQIRHFTMDEAELSAVDVDDFSTTHLPETMKQPLYRKSKSQVSARCCSSAAF